MFKNFRAHLLENHPIRYCQHPAQHEENVQPHDEPILQEQPDMVNDFFQNLNGITNMVIFQNTSDLEEIQNYTCNYISEMRCNVSVPEKFIQNVMSYTEKLITKIESFLWNKVKYIIEKAFNTIDIECIVKTINSFTVGNLFTNINDMDSQIAYMAMKTKAKIPEPTEIVLEERKVEQYKKILTKNGVVRKKITKKIKETYQYISVRDILSLIMRNPDAMEIVEKEEASPEGYICSYKDGIEFKTHPFFRRNPNALRITLNADEIEIVNNLSSRAGKHKIAHFYIKIQNFGKCRDSTYNTNYLILSINSKVLKKHGYHKVLEPLISDLKSLENGVNLKFGNETYIFKAVLCSFAGDTLAAHEIFGLLSPSASYFCRQCYITKGDLRNGNVGATFEQRTEASHLKDLEKIRNQRTDLAQPHIPPRRKRNQVIL